MENNAIPHMVIGLAIGEVGNVGFEGGVERVGVVFYAKVSEKP